MRTIPNLGLSLALILVPSAMPANLAAPPDARAQVDKIFERFNHTDSPGCEVGATIDNATVLAGAYGMADLEHGIALAPESVLEPGSIAKQFTAAAVLLLVQQSKIALDDPVRKYIPEVPDYGTPLTIRHLINHTSGLRDWGSVEGIAGWPRTTREYTHAHVLEIVSHQRVLNYPPGAEYSYTNTGFNLAAILVSRVSGQSFPDFTRDQIFKPLGMMSTQWRDDFRRIVRNRAVAYSQTGNIFRQDMPFEDVYGNGGLLTTAGDLLRWNRNFTDAKVGGRAFVDAQHLRGRLTDGRTIAYAAGLMVLHWKGLNEVSHSGSTAGYQAWLGRYPEQGLSVAVLCNVASANATQLGHQVADVYLASVIHEPPSEARPTDSSVAGLYRSVRDHRALSVEVQDGKLRIDGRLIAEDGPRAEFEKDASGKVVRLRMATQVDEGNYYEKVDRWIPTPGDLEPLTGEYSSDEAEVTFHVALDNNHLVIHRRPDTAIALTPIYRDGFSSLLGSVRFLRDSAGRVTELSIGEQRVWDMRFRRVR
ncbi:MAG TPA: serine hydrolase domain-containing protein [Bryobacteraceae bacterium]|nr:serine hydrolase domain-containing protein [Bryobacteraceae bacterium]